MTSPLTFTEDHDGDRTVLANGRVYRARQAQYPNAEGWLVTRQGLWLALEPDWAGVVRKIRGDR